MIRLNPAFLNRKISRHYDRLLSTTQSAGYDHILIIKGEGTPAEAIGALRRQHPGALMTLYNWDEVAQYRQHYDSIRPYFDRVLSFDPHDCARYGMEFMPNFYEPSQAPVTVAPADVPYDLMFVGTMHPSRLALIAKIKDEAVRLGLKPYLYLYRQHRLLHIYDLIMAHSVHAAALDMQYTPMPRDKMGDIYRQSRIVLDINREGQRGLSQRSVETIGARRKLITTNADVVNYDFYHPSNVLVIDRHEPKIDMGFVATPYIELTAQVYDRYSIDNWIANVFG